MFSRVGISFVTWSTRARGIFRARPTSFSAAFAAIVPNVPICATLAAPYLLRTYSMTSYRRSLHRSMSISGASERFGSRNRSNSRSYFSGQTWESSSR